MAENPYFKEHLGDLEEKAARDIVKHLRFLHRLEAIVELKNDAEISPGELARRLEWLLHRAERQLALDELVAGQCEGIVGAGVRCELAAGHDGPHKPDPNRHE